MTVGDGSRGRGNKAQEPFLICHPPREAGIVFTKDAARALEDPPPIFRLENAPCQSVTQNSHGDGRVVVATPKRGNLFRRPSDPAETNAGNSIGFREPAG